MSFESTNTMLLQRLLYSIGNVVRNDFKDVEVKQTRIFFKTYKKHYYVLQIRYFWVILFKIPFRYPHKRNIQKENAHRRVFVDRNSILSQDEYLLVEKGLYISTIKKLQNLGSKRCFRIH